MSTFDSQMVDLQQQVATAYATEITRLRQENAALRKAVAEFPSTASELQDRVTMLESAMCALRMLYDETADYIQLNSLGGMDNQCMRLARAALRIA